MTMRIGLGCMRLSRADSPESAHESAPYDQEEEKALATLRAAAHSGITLFDTARTYGRSEQWLGRALSSAPHAGARIVTKCGMRREGAAWIPDGRARSIREDVDASRAALGPLTIDTLLLHVPDPRTPLPTSVRALARAAEHARIPRVGVSNVSRKQLEEAAAVAPIAVVEIALGAYDDLAARAGVVAYCMDHGIEVLAHAPLGGPKRVARLGRDTVLTAVARELSRDGWAPTAIEVFLAYLLALPKVTPVVGAGRPETIASFVRAEALVLGASQLALLDARFPVLGALRVPFVPETSESAGRGASTAREVVVMMGIPGAGKSRAAEALVTRGYERLNRDTLGGTLRGIAKRLDERLRAGAERVVLDNTYVTRATRNDVIRIARAHRVNVRCVFFDTPAHEAQINAIHRMIDRFGSVLGPADLARRSREDPAALAPTAIAKMVRELEPPSDDEGFASIETVVFERAVPRTLRGGLAISLDLPEPEILRLVEAAPPGTCCLLYAWRPGADHAALASASAFASMLAERTGLTVEAALCVHPGGPPICWCRPPLPGSWLAFARRHGLDSRASTLHSASATDRAMARALCMNQ